ncbi:glutaredoxin 3 [Guyparkeria sp. GHLCS8-2]|uniref:glutaredoxin 3 n=1 Tax=Guyparkeria halopsychrophila TaxID=3139421 RepID=UPI0037C73FC8
MTAESTPANDQPAIVVYQSPLCPFCHFAKRLLKKRGLAFESINVQLSSAKKDEMIQRAKRLTVPQIFIGETHVGGYDELAALDRDDRLMSLVEAEARRAAGDPPVAGA